MAGSARARETRPGGPPRRGARRNAAKHKSAGPAMRHGTGPGDRTMPRVRHTRTI